MDLLPCVFICREGTETGGRSIFSWMPKEEEDRTCLSQPGHLAQPTSRTGVLLRKRASHGRCRVHFCERLWNLGPRGIFGDKGEMFVSFLQKKTVLLQSVRLKGT